MAGRQDPSTPSGRAASGWAAGLPRTATGRLSRLGAVLVLAVLLLTGTAIAGAADDPSPPAAEALVSGVEGSKAALVRIEVSATAEIAHIDHSTGDVNVMRGRYEVPIRSGTGVFTSADGVIATAGTTLAVTEEQVVVHAANRLFQEQMGTALVGNDGDLSRRAQAVDRYWAPHLQHCYDQVEHCILFFVPQYQIFPHTRQATGTPADVLPVPDGSTDVGLLRISGGGGTPTAELASSGQAVPTEALLTGFTQRPDPVVPPGELAVGVDATTGALSSGEDVAGAMAAGMAGGPVLDPATGQVTGLATVVDGQTVLVAAQRLREALEAAGAPPAGSEFDAVFRRGIDHLASGNASASAASALQESLTYYDSALAAAHLEEASRAAEEESGGATGGADDEGGTPGGAGPWVVAGVLVVLLLLGLALFLRRRRADSRVRRAAAHAAPSSEETTAAARQQPNMPPAAPQPPPPAHPAATVPVRPAGGDDASASRERTRLRQSPALVRDSVPPWQASPAFCSDCGVPLRGGARFCGSCGSPVS
jgi:hypothetical protein